MQPTIQLLSLAEEPKEHDHDYHQLVLAVAGSAAFSVAGREQALTETEACILPAGTEHRYSGRGDNQLVVVNLMPPELQTQKELGALFQQAGYLTIEPSIQVLARALAYELSYRPDDPVLAEACTHTLLCALSRCYFDGVKANKQGEINLTLLDDFIRQHLQEPISIGQLAQQACMSPSHFHARFKQVTGVTPYQYVSRMRLNYARQLLQQTNFTLAEVAQRSGFSCQSALSHACKRHFNLSPARLKRAELSAELSVSGGFLH